MSTVSIDARPELCPSGAQTYPAGQAEITVNNCTGPRFGVVCNDLCSRPGMQLIRKSALANVIALSGPLEAISTILNSTAMLVDSARISTEDAESLLN